MGRLRRRLSSPLTAGALLVALGSPAVAAGLDAAGQADLRRAFAAASLSTSEEPAVRAERREREPSPGFMLGAALGAWTAAAAQLDFDIRNPTAAGPPHASQSGDNGEAIAQDCVEENTAFSRLDARAAALGPDPKSVLDLAGAPEPERTRSAWLKRRGGPVPGCRPFGPQTP